MALCPKCGYKENVAFGCFGHEEDQVEKKYVFPYSYSGWKWRWEWPSILKCDGRSGPDPSVGGSVGSWKSSIIRNLQRNANGSGACTGSSCSCYYLKLFSPEGKEYEIHSFEEFPWK